MKSRTLRIGMMVLCLSLLSAPLYAEQPVCTPRPFDQVLTTLQSKRGFFFNRWSNKRFQELSEMYDRLQDELLFKSEIEQTYRSYNREIKYRALKYSLSVGAMGAFLYGFVWVQTEFQASPIRDLILILATVFSYSIVESGLAPPIEMLSAMLKQTSYHFVGRRFYQVMAYPGVDMLKRLSRLYARSHGLFNTWQIAARDDISLAMAAIHPILSLMNSSYLAYQQSVVADLPERVVHHERFHYYLALVMKRILDIYTEQASEPDLIFTLAIKEPYLDAPGFEVGDIDFSALEKHLKVLDPAFSTGPHQQFYKSMTALIKTPSS